MVSVRLNAPIAGNRNAFARCFETTLGRNNCSQAQSPRVVAQSDGRQAVLRSSAACNTRAPFLSRSRELSNQSDGCLLVTRRSIGQTCSTVEARLTVSLPTRLVGMSSFLRRIRDTMRWTIAISKCFHVSLLTSTRGLGSPDSFSSSFESFRQFSASLTQAGHAML